MELTTVRHTSLREDVSSAQDWCDFMPASYGFCNIVLSLVGGWLAVKTSPEPRYPDILGFWAGFHGYRRGPGEQVLRHTSPCIAVYILVSGHNDVGMEKGFEFGENKATEYLIACFLAQVICFVASNERRQVLKRTSPCSFVPRNPSCARRETFPPYERDKSTNPETPVICPKHFLRERTSQQLRLTRTTIYMISLSRFRLTTTLELRCKFAN